MRRLATGQALPGSQLAPFASDGCSGGMSSNWQTLAERLAGFAERYGDAPPWEACCVEHDRAYWRGETEDGYRKRLRADQELRTCVAATGIVLAEELSTQLDVSENTVTKAFAAAGQIMFTAVRAGGGPCTGLPWRWGYGWPSCPSPDAGEDAGDE